MLVIIGLLLFVSLVVLHELGHFFAAKKSGVVVEEFGLGFPPKAKTIGKKNGTKYTLNWLPLGGFVRLKGEHDSAKGQGAFGAASLKQKSFIMLAGVVVNFLTAIILLTLIALIGMPKLLPYQFSVASDTKVTRQDVLLTFVEKGSPADKAGLIVGDRLVSIANTQCDGECFEPIDDRDDVRPITQKLAGKEVKIVFQRSGQGYDQITTARLLSSEEVQASEDAGSPKGYLGLIPENYTVQRSTWSAPIVGIGTSLQLTKLGFEGVGSLVSSIFKGDVETVKDQTVGPIGIVGIIRDNSSLGFVYLLMLIAVISLSLAIMNLLPIPVLDGGRLYLTLFYHLILRKPLIKKTEERVVGTAYVIMVVLFVLITLLDVNRFFL
jgi:regulator of sigma E protease